MIKSHIEKELERKIDLYVNGQLSNDETEELWAELIRDDKRLEYLKSVANVKAVIESNRSKATIYTLSKFWSYAAAAVIALTLGVLAVVNYVDFNSTGGVEPIAAIELEYYRSSEGVISPTDREEIIRNAIALANTGHVEEAVALLEKELEDATEPEWIARLSLNLGSLAYNTDNFEQAALHFERAAEQPGIDVLMLEKAYWYLGNAYFQQNRLVEASETIRKAYDLNGAYRRVAKSYLNALAEATGIK